ncbi:hypothetical protein ACFV4P_35440 [Kitasatospora sp. NPDC059795]|uniref:hypothetical protein n=1 Tax=Kitasatospora sp. NPDC059795 TaxID=3346949 RepID=UPI003662832F
MTKQPNLPIIGNLRPDPSQGPSAYAATEPITGEQLREVERAEWCRSVNTNGRRATTGRSRYFLLAEFEGDVLVVTGEFTGVR